MSAERRGSLARWFALQTVLPIVARPSDRASAPVLDGAQTVRRRRGWARATLVTARPRQWVKNVLVIAAPGAAGALGHDDVRVGLACLAFCLISAGIYTLNDVRDAPEDRRHPRKCLRPIAAGELAARDAVLLGVGALLGGLALCLAIRPPLAVVAIAYVALTLSYTGSGATSWSLTSSRSPAASCFGRSPAVSLRRSRNASAASQNLAGHSPSTTRRGV